MREYSVVERCCFWLSLLDGMSVKKKHELLHAVGGYDELYYNFVEHSSTIIEVVGNKHFGELSYFRQDNVLEDRLKRLDDYDIDIVTIESEEYPDNLRSIDDPPLMLYYKGKIELLKAENTLAVVGSRNPTRYGKDITRTLVGDVARAGVTIVSGLARGVDKIAHSATLDNDGSTIAVVATGLETCYPAENHELFERISIFGLVVSEYPVGSTPYAYRFPERNRIISGLARGTLVTEAGMHSGSLITMNTAIEQGRNIYLVPGNINSQMSQGTNDAIKQLQGAMVTCAEDILCDYDLDKVDNKDDEIALTDIERSLVDYIVREDRHIDEITAFVGDMEVGQLLPILSKLELFGLIQRLPGNYYGK